MQITGKEWDFQSVPVLRVLERHRGTGTNTNKDFSRYRWMALVGFRRIPKYGYICLFNKRNFKDYPASLLPRKSFQVGDEAKLSKVFSDNDVETFADLTGDRNPLHLDEKYAANTRFGRCIVHGVLINGYVESFKLPITILLKICNFSSARSNRTMQSYPGSLH